jgi:hypothetical protein
MVQPAPHNGTLASREISAALDHSGGHTITAVDRRIPRSEEQAPGPDDLPSAAMVTQYEAARYLGVSVGKIGWLVFRGHLTGSRHGVTVGSLRKERQWRATASPGQKICRVLADALRSILDGL